MDETFGDRLRRLRKAQKITQRVLAKKAGTTQGYITELETSKANNPSMEISVRLARALNVSVKELTGQEEGALPTHIQNFSLWLVSKNVNEETLAEIVNILDIYITHMPSENSSQSVNDDVNTDVNKRQKLGTIIERLTASHLQLTELLSSLKAIHKQWE
jgi:transcriptional regulator with XRE-family HTH domain